MGRILITGATGFLGGTLCRHLAAEGESVLATGRNGAKLAVMLRRPGLETIPLDLSDAVPDVALARLQDVDTIVHAAALSSPWGRPAEFERDNVTATANLVTLAKTLGVRRFVFVSSPSVYFRFADQLGIRETQDLPAPVNDYARTKRAPEMLVLAEPAIGPVVIRPRGIYGAGDTALLPRLIRRAKAGALPLLRGAVAVTDITHVDDVCSAIVAALRAQAAANGEIFNVSGGVALRLTDIIAAACSAAGVTPRWRRVSVGLTLAMVRGVEAACAALPNYPEPPVTAYALGILAYSQTLDISKVEAMLGWRPRITFEEGLSRTFEGDEA